MPLPPQQFRNSIQRAGWPEKLVVDLRLRHAQGMQLLLELLHERFGPQKVRVHIARRRQELAELICAKTADGMRCRALGA